MAPVSGFAEAFRRQAFGSLQDPRTPAIGRLAGALESFQTSVLECFAPLYRMPFVRGSEIAVPALAAAGTFGVVHKLGRVPRGYLVLDCKRASGATGALSIYSRTGDARTDSVLTLYGSASFESLTIWVW